MNSINVSVEYADKTYNFTLLRTTPKPPYPTFPQLCEALIHHLDLRAVPSQLVSRHPPIYVWYRSGDDLIRMRNDSSVRDALRKTPHKLRLRVRYRNARLSKSETSSPSHPPTRTDTLDEPEQPSVTTLLRLLNHAENHALDDTKEAFEELRQSMLKFSGDAANLANARHRLARLFCSFLRRLADTPIEKVPDRLQEALLSRLEVILEDEDISEGTMRAARRAVRMTCSDRHALIHMRARWAVISGRLARAAPPSTAAPSSKAPSKENNPNRPIKHYQNHVQKLVRVGGTDVKDAYKRLMRYAKRHDSFEKADSGITRNLCRSVEKVVFHVVRCHRKDGKYVIKSHAARALASSVGRKFDRAGFDKRFVSRASGLTRAMVDDPAVVEVVFGWAKKRADSKASAEEGDSGKIRRLAEEDEDELLGGRRDVDDDTTTTSSTSVESSTSTSSADDDIGGSRRSRSASRRSRSASRGSRGSKRSRSASRSASKRSRSRSGSRVGSRGRSRSASKGARDEGSLRSRSRSRSKSQGRGRSRSRSQTGSRKSRRSESRESRASLRSLEEDADEMLRDEELDKLDEIAPQEDIEEDSDDEMKVYRYGKVGQVEESVLSDDTSRSQWARVQMEKEKEKLRKMYMQDRDLFGDDGSTQVDVTRRLRHTKDSLPRRSRNLSPSDDGHSIVSDEPVRRVASMRTGRSPGSRRSRSPFRKDTLWFREVGPQEGLVS